MRTMLTLVVAAALTGCAAVRSQRASVILEFRPGSESAGPGLALMAVPGSGRPVYVSDDILLSNADIASARVVSGPNGFQIEVSFTRVGTERFASATEQNIMKPLAILLDGRLISAPIVREKITGGRAVITGRFTEQEARRIADGIVGN